MNMKYRYGNFNPYFYEYTCKHFYRALSSVRETQYALKPVCTDI